jgi:Skp family chaperone for outer membrane proteins
MNDSQIKWVQRGSEAVMTVGTGVAIYNFAKLIQHSYRNAKLLDKLYAEKKRIDREFWEEFEILQMQYTELFRDDNITLDGVEYQVLGAREKELFTLWGKLKEREA